MRGITQEGGRTRADPRGAATVALWKMRQVLGDIDSCHGIEQLVLCKKSTNYARTVR